MIQGGALSGMQRARVRRSVTIMSLIICCFVAILPLFRRCCLAVFPLLSAAVFRAKREPDQSLERLWICFEKKSMPIGHTQLLRRGGGAGRGAAQFRRVVAPSQERLDVAAGLAQPLAVLDERDAHEPLAVFAEPGA